MQGDPQFLGHQQHLLDGIADARALLPHMDGEGMSCPAMGESARISSAVV